MYPSILVIAAHPDDETIGCGGTILNHTANGEKVYVITLTDGVTSRSNSSDSISDRAQMANEAFSILGAELYEAGNFPDNSMDSISLLEIVQFIEKAKEDIKPSLVYTHSFTDLNIDHRIAASATLTAFRPEPNEICSEIRLFEVPSSTDYALNKFGTFSPNLFIDIKNSWSLKLEALKQYDKELRKYPHTRSYEKIENLAEYRGAQSGLIKAEAFEQVRRIIK
tara:strand:- start:197 stop:868 length:672 start_codon:yes stop_codon:yes gene_type:complete